MTNTGFQDWVRSAAVTDDPVGDFITDARHGTLPRIDSRQALEVALMQQGACAGCLTAVPAIWARYQTWRRAQ